MSAREGRSLTLGTRVTVVVTLLVAAVLAGSGYAALKVRRANLEADLDREAHEIATALRAGIEPLDPGTAADTLLARARAARQHDELFQLEVLVDSAALGSMPIMAGSGGAVAPQLIAVASIYQLERRLEAAGSRRLPRFRRRLNSWGAFGAQLDDWIEDAASALAYAALEICP